MATAAWALLAILTMVTMTGCVMSDSKVPRTPTNVPLTAFSGTYWNTATYASTSPIIAFIGGTHERGTYVPGRGTYVPDQIQDAFYFPAYIPRADSVDRFQIRPLKDGDISVEAFKSDALIASITLKTNQDYTFNAGVIDLGRKWDWGGHDSPGFIIEKKHIRLCLDGESNLIIITSDSAAGLFTIIPFGGTSEGMTVFPRIYGGPESGAAH